ncbi:hypothetical protein ERO13_A09G085500v2 [Gossypium hirsutum]|uniref:Uncharacterized protein isoform X1 n=1 Tax=Gossypium hirsutum TaxID=3635 RepID=A0A1U8HYE5_GOSHI|nr:uncharacterized protein LOC107889144 isoform X1 [Gossypium hirsutum]KAG4183075.1 hypothetical protein ERO13_A09G085500v2 [Gossypium hirsutum]
MDQELDPYICGCIIEFLVRYSPDDMHIKKVIEAFPPLKPRPQLKKAVLLRTMRTEVNAGDVSEKILDVLEKIGCIDRNQGLPIPDSMKEAYCAVALECTVKYLPGDTDTCGAKYLDAVDRIWRGRIQELERSKASDLVFDQLKNRRLQVEAAATGDEDAVRCLSAINTRGYAIVSLRRYLREASGSMKPPVLEQACLKLGRLNLGS